MFLENASGISLEHAVGAFTEQFHVALRGHRRDAL
jgi:hypothetical protein